MPRRTNPFQRIVYLIEHQLAPLGASVEQSIELQNRAGSHPTEVDILVTLHGPGRPMRIGIECQNEKRGSTVEWIRELWGKYSLLDIDRVIAVAGHGFSKDALKEAKCLGINALTIEEAQSFDWANRIRLIQKLLLFDVLYEHIGTSVNVTGRGTMPQGFATDASAILIALPRTPGSEHLGEYVVTLRQFIDRVLSEPGVDDLLARNTESHPNKEGWLGAKLPHGTGIFDAAGRRFALARLHLQFRRVANPTEVRLTHATYDGAAVAVGSGGEKGAVNVALVHVEGAAITGKVRILIDGYEQLYDLPDMTRGL
jgi:hypothetical protein